MGAVIFLCILGVCLKKRYGARKRKPTKDDADQPLLEEGFERDDASSSSSPSSSALREKKDSDYTKHIHKLTSNELKTADQIRRKYRKESKGQHSVSQDGSSKDNVMPQKHLSNSILQVAQKFSQGATSIDSDNETYHYNKAKQIGSASNPSGSIHIPVPVKDEEGKNSAQIFEDPNASFDESSISDNRSMGRYQMSDERSSTTSSYQATLLHQQQDFVNVMSSSDNQFSKPSDMVDSSFAGEASLHLSIKYLESTDCIIGNIKRLQNINMNAKACPKDISFHLKLLPKGRYRMKTPWRVCNAEDLSLTFTIGPVKTKQVIDSFLCIRLYGRMTKNRFARAKCYGECMVKLNQLFGVEGNVILVKKLVLKNMNERSTDDLRFTTDEESEFA